MFLVIRVKGSDCRLYSLMLPKSTKDKINSVKVYTIFFPFFCAVTDPLPLHFPLSGCTFIQYCGTPEYFVLC